MPWYAWCPERLELIAGRPRVQCVLHQCDSARVERGARRWAWPTAQLRENRRRVHAARPPAHLLGHCEVLEWKFYYLFCYLAEPPATGKGTLVYFTTTQLSSKNSGK